MVPVSSNYIAWPISTQTVGTLPAGSKTVVYTQEVAVSLLPTDAKARKDTPICTGVFDYFPLALAEVARVSKAGNDQHNPGQPLHWAREKSTDHADCILRHLMERGTIGADGMRHSAQMAWRALALLQTELEAALEPVAVTSPPPSIEWLLPDWVSLDEKIGGSE